MKTSTTLQIAAAGLLSMATMATAQSACAVTCFTQVITDHPPLDCKEANMYLCFCKITSLQNYFIQCARDDCPDASEEAISFGTSLCADLGVPIKVPTEEPTKEEPSTPEPTKEPSTPEPTEEPTTPEPTSAPKPDEEEPTKEPTEQPTEEPSTPEPTEEPVVEETSAAAVPTKTSGSAAPSGEVPAGSTPTPTDIVANAGNAVGVSGFVAAAGAALAAFQLL